MQEALGSADGQAELLGIATRVDATRFAKAAALWAAALDRAALERSHQAQRAARFLHLAETPSGTRLTGLLDATSGHRLRLALESMVGRPAPDDDRSPEQRRADALADLAQVALAGVPTGGVPTPSRGSAGPAGGAAGPAGDVAGPGGVEELGGRDAAGRGAGGGSPTDVTRTGTPPGPRASVTFVLREETWAALRRAGPSGGRTTDGPGGADGVPRAATNAFPGLADRSTTPEGPSPTPPATLEDGTPLPWSETARLLCDCELTRVVVDARGQPLDLGRTVRRFTAGQRRAVTIRDGGCFWPHCGAPPRWCEVHHLVWWDQDDGPTAVLDGALACSFHHHELHRLDLAVTRYLLPDVACAVGESRVRYVVATPGGKVVADGRPVAVSGARTGTAVRAWVPGLGTVDPSTRPRTSHRSDDARDGLPALSAAAGSLTAWTS